MAHSVRTHRRPTTRVVLALTLVISTLGVIHSAGPAAAISAFDITIVPVTPAIAGAEVDLDISVFNGGPDEAETALLSVSMPAGLTLVGWDNCHSPNECLIGSFGLIGVGDSATVRVRAAIDPSYVLDHGAGTTSAEALLQISVEYDGGAQSKNAGISVGERSDLRIETYVNPPVANAGEQIRYQVVVDNLGPSTARDVAISDTMFAGVDQPNSLLLLQGCAFSVTLGGGLIEQFNCATGPVGAFALGANVGTFSTDQLLPVGLYPDPDPGDPPFVGGRLRGNFILVSEDALTMQSEAQVVSLTADPDGSNNVDAAAGSFDAVADLGIAATVDTPTAAPGDTVTYTLTATNHGPSNAPNVVVEGHLPGGLDLVSASTPGGTCLSGTPGDAEDPVVCLLGTISGPLGADPPSAEVITIVARVADDATIGAVLSHQAWARSGVPDLVNANDGAEAPLTVVEPDLTFNALTPTRQLDTRDGTGGVPVGKVAGGTALELTVAGVDGVPVGATAVALNVTITAPSGEGWATVYPCAAPLPVASNLNFVAGQTVANAVIAPLDAAGKVCFATTDDAHIVSDVSGWFRPATALTTLTPVREFDTRTGTGGVPVGPRAAGSVLTFKVTGVNGVPGAGVSAVALNLTAVAGGSSGYVTAFPCGNVPVASNLNFAAGQTVPNLVVAPVSPQGNVCFLTSASTHLLADVSGWFASGSDHHAVNPSRVFDTRSGLGGVPAAKLVAGGVLEVSVTGRPGIPASDVGAVVLNLTATGPAAGGYLTVFPCGDRPLTSNLNVVAQQTVANAVVAPVSPDGTVCFYSNVATHLLADVSGWLAG